jgi:hypothetical protein
MGSKEVTIASSDLRSIYRAEADRHIDAEFPPLSE